MSNRQLCPFCGADILNISKYCDECGRLLLTEEDQSNIQNWVFQPKSKQVHHQLLHLSKDNYPKRKRFRNFLVFDPIVKILLKAGVITFLQNWKIYLTLILTYLMIFTTFAGILVIFGNIQILVPVIGPPINVIVGTTVNFFIAWLITTSTQLLSYTSILEKGDLGLKFDFEGTKRSRIPGFSIFSAVLLIYFILWAAFLRIGMILNSNTWSTPPPLLSRIVIFGIAFIIVIILLGSFFILTVRFTYAVYNLSFVNIPIQVVDGVLFILGLIYGLMLLGLAIFPFPEELVVIVIFILPGTVISPVFAYSMAHLRVASAIFENEK